MIKLILYSFLAFIVLCAGLLLEGNYEFNDILPLVFGYMGFLVVLAIGDSVVRDIKIKQFNKKKKREKEEKQQAARNIIENGGWKFPVELFYEECAAANVTPDNTDAFSIQKMQTLANAYYAKAQLPKKYIDEHNAKLSIYYEQGAIKHKNAEEKKYQQSITPCEGDLPFTDVIPYNIGQLAQNALGIEKRQIHLDCLITLQDHLAKRAHDALENNPWVAEQAKKDFHWYTDRKKLLEKEYAECSKKVTLPSKHDLLKLIKISKENIRKTDSKTLTYSAYLSTNVTLPNENLVLDGILHSKVYCEDIFVDDLFIPLPLSGITKENGGYVEAACKKSLAIAKPYRVEIVSANLSFVEKTTNKLDF